MGQCFGPADAATRGNAMTFFFHLGDSSTLCANYELMVHVAGHTLGLSGFSLLDLLSEERIYTIAHPKISDSVIGPADAATRGNERMIFVAAYIRLRSENIGLRNEL